MNRHHNRAFHNLFDRGEALRLEKMSFEGCEFSNCALSLTSEFDRRSILKDLTIRSCVANGCDVGPAEFENVEVDGLATNDLLIVWGATFNKVTLRGEIGKLKINPFVHHVDRSIAVQGPFDRRRNELYGSIDWALDISSARFKEFDVRGIPARLFRRDPETQMVVTRARALATDWQEKVSSWNTLWPFAIKLFLSDGVEDSVLVAPLAAPKKRRDELLRGLRELRELGVLEPS